MNQRKIDQVDSNGTSHHEDWKSIFTLSGHVGTDRWHSSMSPTLLGSRNGMYVINGVKTVIYLSKALQFLHAMVSRGSHVIVVNANPSYNGLVQTVCRITGHSYVNERWVGGTLTNWHIVSHGIYAYQRIADQFGPYASFLGLSTPRYEKMSHSFRGFQPNCSRPEIMVVLTPGECVDAVHEAHVLDIPVIAICDSDMNQAKISYPIPGNNESYDFVYTMMNFIGKTIQRANGLYQRRVEQGLRAPPRKNPTPRPQSSKKDRRVGRNPFRRDQGE